MPRPIFVLINPNAGRHRRPADVARVARLLGSSGRVQATSDLTEVSSAVQQMVSEGSEIVAISGGDGTLGGVLNELLAQLPPGAALPALLPTNSGTIDFVARKVGIRGSIEQVLGRLVRAVEQGQPVHTVEVDSLKLEGTWRREGQSQPFSRIGFALAAGGIGQRFFAKYYSEPRLGASAIVRVVAQAVASYALGRVPARVPARLLEYGRDVFSPTLARVTIDGVAVEGERHGAIHAGAFDVSLGGVFRVFPLARERGALHFQAGEIVPEEMIFALPSLVRGSRIPSKRLVETCGQRLQVEARGPELLAPILDGEPLEHVETLTVTLGPRVRIAKI